MDSINQQQEERNHENLQGTDAAEKIKEMAEKVRTCFFCTGAESGKPFSTRPMSVQKVDEVGNLWFLSANDSHKNKEIMTDDAVQLLFQGNSSADYLSIYGSASVSADKKKIEELWNPLLKTWFTEGKDDPRISVIKVIPEHGYYWDTKHGSIIAFLKMVAGAAIGKTMDDSIEGDLSV